MSANFTPDMQGYSEQGAFRFWCQKVLPLVFDDSLSYYELLNKVVTYLNNVIGDMVAVEGNVERLLHSFVELQAYVNNYFDDLDIEAELKNVLDRMALDGSLNELLNPVVLSLLPNIVSDQIDGVVSEQIGGVVDEQIGAVVDEKLPPLVNEGIPGEVSDWLTENVDPVGSAVVVDSSLTVSGAAADAKATGDEISELKTQSNERWNSLTSDSEANPNDFYVSGTIRATDGVVSAGTNRLTNTVKINNASILEIKANEGYGYYLYAWDGDTYIGSYRNGSFEKARDAELQTSHVIAKYPATYNFLINLKRIDDANINVSEAQNIIYLRNALGPDTTLTKDGEAADAKATGDAINELKEHSDDRWASLTSESTANPSDFYVSGHIRATDGVVMEGTNRLTNTEKIKNTGILEISVADGYQFYLYAWNGATYLGSYRNGAFEKAYGAEPLTFHNISQYPAEYEFLINVKRTDNTDVDVSEAENIIFIQNALGPDTSLEKVGQAADSKTVGDKLGKIDNAITSVFSANPSDYYVSGAIPAATGEVNTGTTRLTNYEKITNKDVFEIEVDDSDETNGYGFYLYAWNGNTYLGSYRSGTFAKAVGAELLTSMNIAQYPSTYSFLINLKRRDNADISKDEAQHIIYTGYESYKLERDISAINDSLSNAGINTVFGLHTVPESKGVLNCIKRARQMTDVEWTPAVDLPRVCRVMGNDYNHNQTYQDVFKAGVKYKGIPYSNTVSNPNANYLRKYVGFDVSIETFITAIENPNSVIAKESFYDGTKLHSTIYGLVCSAFISYVIGLSTPKTTSSLPTVDGMVLIGKVIEDGTQYDLSTLKLCDILNISNDHGVIITDIVRNENGSIKFIEISEETIGGNGNPNNKGGQNGGLCRRRGFTPEEIYEYYGNYDIYRYSYLYNVTYTPSAFVNVGDELDRFRFDALPCMPYMGEKAKYKASDLRGTKILINCPGYDYLRVFKDGTEISGSPFALSESTTDVDTGFSAVGNYEAYLSKFTGGVESGTTLRCHWSVI